MQAVITGDIINSRSRNTALWLKELDGVLNHYGSKPKDWEIYRGDSFQLKTEPANGIHAMIHIKAAIKKIKGLDVRMSLGIGKISYHENNITESNGEAFINSGEAFEKLKKETMAIKSPWESVNKELGLMLSLASVKMDEWPPISSEIIKESLENPELTQKELAGRLGKKQSDISKGIKRAGFDSIKKLMNYYKNKITELC